MTSTHYITIDLWDTLYHDDPISDRRRKHVRRQMIAAAFKCSSEEIEPYHKAADEWARNCWYRSQRTVGASERIRRIEYLTDEALTRDTREELARSIEEVGSADPPRPVDGAAGLLESVRESHKTILISDTGVTPGRVLREIINTDGLGPLLDGYVFSDEIGAAKPAGAPFWAARKMAGGSGRCAFHIGDNSATDVAGALAFGVMALHLSEHPCDKFKSHFNYRHIQNLEETLKFIR